MDSELGSDSNAGTSESAPWQTLDQANWHAYQPGDTIHFRRGRHWNDGLVIYQSGTSESPITYTTYGEGARPTFTRPGGQDAYPKAVYIESDWIVVDGLHAVNTHETGFFLADTAEHVVIRDCEASHVGVGVGVEGQYNLITEGYFHDLTMVNNTQGGDDDYGAVGVWLYASNNEVSYNRMERCKAPSYDYGYDGGAVEFYGVVNNSHVHHNWAEDCMGFLEAGGPPSGEGEAHNTWVHHNVVVNCIVMLSFNLGEYQYAIDVQGYVAEHNTVIENEPWETAINMIRGEISGDQLTFRNNVLDGHYKFARTLPPEGGEVLSTGFVHDHNLFNGIGQGFSLGEGELLLDPRLVDRDDGDYGLSVSSPAIDAALDQGHALDYAGHLMPSGGAPDMGAYEFESGVEPPATPTNTAAPPTATPTNTAVPPTPTNTLVPPTATPTNTPVPPTLTPTNTAVQPTATPTANPDEIIIDDGDAGFSTRSTQDAWTQYVAAEGEHYGRAHVYNAQIGTGGDVATWTFDVPRSGTYAVYAWWWEGDWRPTDVPYTIYHLDGETVVRVDQQLSGGQWNPLGSYVFGAGGSITVSDDASSGQDVVADAVRLVYVGEAPTPTDVPALPTATPTVTSVPPTSTPTATPVPPTATPRAPTATPTHDGSPVALSAVGQRLLSAEYALATLRMDAGSLPVERIEASIIYEPDKASFVAIDKGSLAAGMTLTVNEPEPGTITVVIEGDALSGNGDLAVLSFCAIKYRRSKLILDAAVVNGGDAPVSLASDRLYHPWRRTCEE